jgi:hypothetical protein
MEEHPDTPAHRRNAGQVYQGWTAPGTARPASHTGPNNDAQGFAVASALELTRLLGGAAIRPPIPPGVPSSRR